MSVLGVGLQGSAVDYCVRGVRTGMKAYLSLAAR